MGVKIYKITLILIVLLSALYTLSYHRSYIDAGGFIKIWFFDVGQGDAILLKDGTQYVLVDGGPNYEIVPKIFAIVNPFKCFINEIVITHAHLDHYMGVLRLLDLCAYQNLYFNSSSIKSYTGSPLFISNQIETNFLKLYVLWPPKDYLATDLNDTSIVLLVDYKNIEVLLTGDAGKNVLNKIDWDKFRYLIQGKLDIYKVSHHGSEDGFDPNLLTKLNIENAVISVGKNNRYNHPSSLYTTYFQENNINLFRTDELGDVTFVLQP